MNLADRAGQYLGKGIKEVSGSSSHPQIYEWLTKTEELYPSDTPMDDSKYAWCGVFVGNMVLDEIADGGQIPEPPEYFQGAKKWETYGCHVPLHDGERGDVLVVTRDGGHHVTIIAERQADGYLCTGGNQSDSVNQSFYSFSKAYAVRRP